MFLQPEITAWLARIESEYREMPGLTLTKRQMTRMWNLDDSTCGVLLHLLVARGVLREIPGRAYIFAAAATSEPPEASLAELRRG